MNNEKLRRQMLWFVGIFAVLGIVGIYIKNNDVQKNGPKQGIFAAPSDWQTEAYDDGKIKGQGPMKDGYLKDGEWTYFREDGSVEMKEIYKDGVIQSIKEDSAK